MTNGEKYKDQVSRQWAFWKHMETLDKGVTREGVASMAFAWLEQEFYENIMDCPFCGNHTEELTTCTGFHFVRCGNNMCGYCSPKCKTRKEAIEKHNELVDKVAASEAEHAGCVIDGAKEALLIENSNLRKALEPVLNCNTEISIGLETAARKAIFESQKIARENGFLK